MSYQNAVVNCRRCYSLARYKISANTGRVAREIDRGLNENNELFQARNQAMQALERTFVSDFDRSDPENIITQNIMRQNFDVTRALDSCMNCLYNKPEIAEIFEPTDDSV